MVQYFYSKNIKFNYIKLKIEEEEERELEKEILNYSHFEGEKVMA